MTLEILIHDVGHGQAILAHTPNEQNIVIDLGCSNEFSPLRWLRKQTNTIDSLIITHPHGDHLDEILLLEELNFHVTQIQRPKWLTEKEVRDANQTKYSDKLDRYLQISQSYNIPVAKETRIGNPAFSGGVTMSCFYSKNCGKSNINNHSCVVIFEYLGLKVVIPGDNEPASWKELISNPNFKECANEPDIFLVSHHGRESGYYSNLFDRTTGINKPKLCIISDGKVQDTDATNRYSKHAQGWTINSRNGKPKEKRYCLTTRSDGYIEISLGSNGNKFIEVTKN